MSLNQDLSDLFWKAQEQSPDLFARLLLSPVQLPSVHKAYGVGALIMDKRGRYWLVERVVGKPHDKRTEVSKSLEPVYGPLAKLSDVKGSWSEWDKTILDAVDKYKSEKKKAA
jgi:hypothetical protein